MAEETSNQMLLDSSLRHQIGVRRYAGGEAKKVLALLEKADQQLVQKLKVWLDKHEGKAIDVRSERYKKLIADIRALRAEVMAQYKELVRSDMTDLARSEAAFEQRALEHALPFTFEFAAVSADTLRAMVIHKPFAGGPNAARTLNEWFTSLAAADQRRLVDAINMGLTQQETVGDIIRRVAGTREAQYTNGALTVTRQNAEAIVRTAVNHVSNAARDETWKANHDIIHALRWNATLDGRTSAICRARDGHFAPLEGDSSAVPDPRLVPETARPPAHPNCRSVMIAVLDSEGVAAYVGDRPFVRDARTRRQREIDFRADAKAQVGEDKWSKLDASQRNALIRDHRSAWAQRAIGQVPSDMDYDTWLRAQPAKFQDEVLGKGKAVAFRNGLKLDKFVDRQGSELTLAELEAQEPGYFD